MKLLDTAMGILKNTNPKNKNRRKNRITPRCQLKLGGRLDPVFFSSPENLISD